MKRRVCVTCKRRKKLSRFPMRTDHGVRSRRKECSTCKSAARRARYLRDPMAERKYYWQRKGIDVSEAVQRLADHDGRCGLCGRDKPLGMGDWHVDHDHVTKKIRGLLCFPCNNMLGKVERVGLEKVSKYLRRP